MGNKMQLLYECSGAHCSGFILWSCASLLWRVGRKTGVEMPDASMALFGFWVLLDVASLVAPPCAVHHRCVVKYCISYFRAIWELFARQPEVWYTLSKMLEVASFTTAMTLQYASVCLGLLWGLQDAFLPPLCPLPGRACNTSQSCSTFAGPFASTCQKILSESLLLRLHDSGPQLCMQDPNLVCVTQYTKNIPPLDLSCAGRNVWSVH